MLSEKQISQVVDTYAVGKVKEVVYSGLEEFQGSRIHKYTVSTSKGNFILLNSDASKMLQSIIQSSLDSVLHALKHQMNLVDVEAVNVNKYPFPLSHKFDRYFLLFKI